MKTDRIGLTNLRYISKARRNYGYEVSSRYDGFTTYESGFVDLPSVHSIFINIYIHNPNLGHDSSMGVKGESIIIKKVTVSSSFGYLTLGSAVAPHDKEMCQDSYSKHWSFHFGKYMVMLLINMEQTYPSASYS